MKARVKAGAQYCGAREGEMVEVNAHQLMLVPWCLEIADERQEGADVVALDKMAPNKKRRR